jgi:hypothetical protein
MERSRETFRVLGEDEVGVSRLTSPPNFASVASGFRSLRDD